MEPLLSERFSEIISMSTAMLRCAEASEWLELAELETKRRALIAIDMQGPPPGMDHARYAQVLSNILSLDAKTMALARTAHIEHAKQLQAIGVGRNAIQAYVHQSR